MEGGMVATMVGSKSTRTLVTREANPIRVGGRDVCVTFTIKGGHAEYGVGALYLGLARPGLEPRDGKHYWRSEESRAWWMNASSGRLYGSGKQGDDPAGGLRMGDRLTVVLTAGGGGAVRGQREGAWEWLARWEHRKRHAGGAGGADVVQWP